jgi:glycosyltransferase involved in cell wall biosynthesis
VSGIYPPDIGGPATHASDLRDELHARGHDTAIVTLGDVTDAGTIEGVTRLPRALPVPARMARVASWIASAASWFDVVYATGLHAEAVAGARVAGVPSVVKIVGDPVWERARRLGLTGLDFEDFQRAPRSRDPRVAAMRWARDRSLRGASAIVTPSAYLAGVVERWLGGPSDVEVIPNGVRVPATSVPSHVDPLRLVYVGRLVSHKRVERLVAAVEAAEGWTLDVIGSGPERERLAATAGPRVRFLGDLPHDEVLAHVGAAGALALASDYEGLPHAVIEALAMGTPVLSPPVGGVPEVVTDGRSGLILPDASVVAVAAALGRLRDDEVLRARLRDGARHEGEAWRFESTADRLLEVFERVRGPRPRVAFVGKTSVPAAGSDAARWETIVRHVEPVVVGEGRAGRRWIGRTEVVGLPRTRPRAFGSALFYGLAPVLGVAATARRRPTAVVCKSPYEGVGVVALARAVPHRLRPRVVVEVHGDWRTASRLYGSSSRGLLAPAADRAAGWAVRHADAVRAVGGFTSELAREAGFDGDLDVYTAFGDLDLFLHDPPADVPDRPDALFVGALEAPKSVDVLIEAWREVRDRVPGARLTIVGSGSQEAALRRQAALASLDGCVRFEGAVPRERVRGFLDASRLLVLPSRSEGLGRVVLEAFARGRPVVASDVGGIPELVDDGVTGRLVPAEDPEALAKALGELLGDASLSSAMGTVARTRVEAREPSSGFDAGIERLAGWAAR